MAGLAGRAVSASAVRTLLGGAIDYAGLFPPAALPMEEAVSNYASYRQGADAWALGRFVVPVSRLPEFRESAAARLPSAHESPWRLSALAGPGGAADWSTASRFEDPGVRIDALELRAGTPGEVDDAASRLPESLDVFYEVPVEADPADLIAAIARSRGKAKVRTGGVTADAFPAASDLARFVATCAREQVPFKATAGLHHPLRATYRLTYAANSATGEMFGFLNVLVAGAFALAGMPATLLAELLVEADPNALRFGTAGVEWRGHRVDLDALARARTATVLSFGSCSFREPIEELEALGLL